MRDDEGAKGSPEEGLARGVVTIVVAGMVLGIVFNGLGLASRSPWGVPWRGSDRLAELESLEEVRPADPGSSTSSGYNQITDPMAIGLGSGLVELPEVPVLDRPIQIGLEAVKQLFDADAALIIDAREAEEFVQGHISGALCMPFDEVTSEPERMESLDARGQPIVVYCGGGNCEVSLGLAWELLAAGQTRVTVYVGGFTEWVEAGYPVSRGAPSVA